MLVAVEVGVQDSLPLEAQVQVVLVVVQQEEQALVPPRLVQLILEVVAVEDGVPLEIKVQVAQEGLAL
jgi:hypothetical protein